MKQLQEITSGFFEDYMKCPNCRNRKIDVYDARGFTSKESPIKECECGHVWRLIPLEGEIKRIDVIRQGKACRGRQ
ncbi:MAG: DUF3797 domain-containing protein [Candidatus Cloacimonetes bacterium]|nr:DUF3797 domain-containing protein [Candidatus Cloacimonadota bacterium]